MARTYRPKSVHIDKKCNFWFNTFLFSDIFEEQILVLDISEEENVTSGASSVSKDKNSNGQPSLAGRSEPSRRQNRVSDFVSAVSTFVNSCTKNILTLSKNALLVPLVALAFLGQSSASALRATHSKLADAWHSVKSTFVDTRDVAGLADAGLASPLVVLVRPNAQSPLTRYDQ